jgi:hypothetical protein
VDDHELVTALIENAAAFNLPLVPQCVESILMTLDIDWLDSSGGREQLLHALELSTINRLHTPDTTTMANALDLSDLAWMVFPGPMIVDVDKLRQALLGCIGPATADPELVDEVLSGFHVPGADDILDLQCVEQMLSTFSNDTLEWMRTSTVPADTASIDADEVQRDLFRLLACFADDQS